MEVRKYVRSLIPAIERKEVINTITTLREELNLSTRPINKDVMEALNGHVFKGSLEKQLTRELRKVANFSQKSGLFVVGKVIDDFDAFLDIMEAQAKRIFSFQFSTFNMTFERASFLQLLDAMMFYVHFHRRFLLELLQEENVQLGKAKKVQWSKGYKQFVQQGFGSYIELTSVFMMKPNDFEAKIKQVSNAEISDETLDLAKKTLGILKTDPFLLERGFMEGTIRVTNPFFSLGKARAERQVRQHKLMKEEITGLQLRLQEYRELREGRPADPKLQKLIEYTESRIEDRNYEVVKFEEENRLDD